MARILIVDDEPNMRRILGALLREDRHAVTEAAGVREAVAAIGAARLDLVITDQKMRDGEGLEVLAASKDADPALPVIILTAFATVDLAVDALRQGAFDFLTKPFTPAAVRAAVDRAVERTGLRRENRLLKDEVDRLGFTADLLGESAAMRAVKERIALVAPTNATVLITGETGTGKELAARAIHGGSDRAGGPVLTDRQVVRVGARAARAIDVRLVFATHRDLRKLVQEGAFREDVYYRIAVVPVEMPPLRDRPEDIPQLVEKFLTDAARELKVPR